MLRVGLIAIALILGCSDSSDPLGDQCRSQCSLAQDHPCFAQQDDCVNKCRVMASSVEGNSEFLKGCATCLVGQVAYSVNPSNAKECWGVAVPQPQNASDKKFQACVTQCIEPDGGMPF